MSSVKLLMQLIPDDIQDLIISIGVSDIICTNGDWGDLDVTRLKALCANIRADVFMTGSV